MLTEPLTHQKAMQKTILPRTAFGILWDMGIGKTWVGCWLIERSLLPDLLATDKSKKKYLVACPNNVTDVWFGEMQKHTQIADERICILVGTSRQRKKLIADPRYNVFIINYEGLRVLEEELLAIPFEIVIADESQRIKNFKADQTKIACAIAEKAKYKFILSGTPIIRSLTDIYSQWYFMGKQEVFKINPKLSLRAGFFVFRSKYFEDLNVKNPHVQFSNWQPKTPKIEKFIRQAMLADCHRLEKDECLNLPPKVFKTLRCSLSKEQERVYNEIKKECVSEINNKEITVLQAMTKMLRLNQITSGFIKHDDHTTDDDLIVFEPNPKMKMLVETVDEILENPRNKVIVWAHFRKDIENITETLKKYNPVHIYGGTKDKSDKVNTFQEDPKCRVFVGQPRSAGTGITLTAANYAIRYSYSFSLEDMLQSEDRCHRKGSEKHKSIVYIDLIMRGTIDEAIIGSLRGKHKMVDAVMTYVRENS